MPLSSTSTIAELRTAYVSNAMYRQTASISSAQEFAASCRWLLLRLPEETTNRDGGAKFRLQIIEQDLAEVTKWLAENASAPLPDCSTPSVRLVGFNNSRD